MNDDLKSILDKHALYLDGSEDGARADLSDANLHCANLRGADLSGAKLRDADLSGAVGNRKEIKSIFISSTYHITYTNKYLRIGCKRHKISDWWDFDNNAIYKMDGSTAVNFWSKYKSIIKNIIDLCPADPTGKEE